MREGVRKTLVVFCALFILAVFVLSGCTRYANEDQLQALDETKAAAMSAEDKAAQLEKDKAALEAKLAQKQDELKKVQQEKEKIQAKVQ